MAAALPAEGLFLVLRDTSVCSQQCTANPCRWGAEGHLLHQCLPHVPEQSFYLASLLQLVKLASLDSAGRAFAQTSDTSKQAFLAAFGARRH